MERDADIRNIQKEDLDLLEMGGPEVEQVDVVTAVHAAAGPEREVTDGALGVEVSQREVLGEVAGEMEAEILRGMLEAQGIKVWISQEGAGRVYGLGVGRLGRVQILVPEDDMVRSKALLEEYYAGQLENQDFDLSNEEQEDADEDPSE